MGYVKYIAVLPPVQDDWWKTVSGRYKYPYEKRRDLRIFGTKRGRENYRHENDYQLMETNRRIHHTIWKSIRAGFLRRTKAYGEYD